ncbi:hypothetical protein ACXZ66_11165 [Corynebacterium sp. S7]
MSELLAADSFSVRDGKVRGLSLHLARFQSACAARGHSVDLKELTALVAGAQGSPRLELCASGVSLRVRPAREETDTVTVAPNGVADARVLPLIKGPDLEWLGAVLSESEYDEVLLLDNQENVVEACFSTPVMFQPVGVGDRVRWEAIFPRHPRQLDSVTAQLVRSALAGLNVEVSDGPPTTLGGLLGQPAWLLNATHVRRIENSATPAWPEELLQLQRDVVLLLDAHAEPIPERSL